jgi:hypothetical protein
LGEIDDRLGRGRRVAAKQKPVVCNGVIFDRVCGICLPFDVRFAPKPTSGGASHERCAEITLKQERRP